MLTKSKRPSTSHAKSNGKVTRKREHATHLRELFEDQLKDILWTEKTLIKAIPRMISLATSDDLILELTDHLYQTHQHITRLAKVFISIDKKPASVKSDAMEDLITEAIEMLETCEKGYTCDAGIIAAAQKIEHYEIATYGTLRNFAETLGLREAENLLMKTLVEEKEADQNLTKVAVNGVNMIAASMHMQLR